METVTLLSCSEADWAEGVVEDEASELRRGGRMGALEPLLIVLRRVPDDGLVECEVRAEGRRTMLPVYGRRPGGKGFYSEQGPGLRVVLQQAAR